MTEVPRQQYPRRLDGRAGFLLTETLATFAISAFVLLGLVSASSVLLHAVDRSVAHVQDVDALGRTMAAVARDISTLSRARWNGIEPQPFVFRGGPNSLYFALRRGGFGAIGETEVVALREIVGPAGPVMTRADAKLPGLATSFEDLSFGGERELATGPGRLRFYYVMAATRDRPEQRRVRSWPVGKTLPAAIVVEAVDAATRRLIVSERISIHANADIGCLSGSATPNANLAPQTTASPQGPQAPVPFLQDANLKGEAGAKDSGFCGRADKADKANKPSVPPPTPGPL